MKKRKSAPAAANETTRAIAPSLGTRRLTAAPPDLADPVLVAIDRLQGRERRERRGAQTARRRAELSEGARDVPHRGIPLGGEIVEVVQQARSGGQEAPQPLQRAGHPPGEW